MSSSWERRKEFLIRSLFQDISVPSTIPETDKESSSSDSWTPPKYRERPAVHAPYQRHSPLPDLIIEREPNRHDETEEFYQKLEKEIFREYRKLFLSDDLSTSLESDVSFIDLERNIENDCLNDCDETVQDVREITEINNQIAHSNEEIRGARPIERSTSTTSSGIFFEIMKVTADVHKENDTEDSNDTPPIDSNVNIQSFNERTSEESLPEPLFDGNDNNEESHGHPDNEQRETSHNSNSSTDEREIEVMRSHRGTPSVNSLHEKTNSTHMSNNPSLEDGEKSFIMESPESNIDTSNNFSSPEHSSTPMKRKMQKQFSLAPSPAKVSKTNVAVQTSDDVWSMKKRLDDWEKLKKNLFMGIPKIYKLVQINS